MGKLKMSKWLWIIEQWCLERVRYDEILKHSFVLYILILFLKVEKSRRYFCNGLFLTLLVWSFYYLIFYYMEVTALLRRRYGLFKTILDKNCLRYTIIIIIFICFIKRLTRPHESQRKCILMITDYKKNNKNQYYTSWYNAITLK